MTRQIDAQGKALIQSFESCRLTAYQDEGGVWTIGWGHTGPDVRVGQIITQSQADILFIHDVQRACQDVEDLVHVGLTDNEFAALVSLDYNIGRIAFASSTLVRLLNGGDFASVPSQLLRWDKIKVNGVFVDSPGLMRRRKAEGTLWLTPDEIDLPHPPAESTTPIEPQQTPIYKTKTVIGGITSFFGGLLDKISDIDFSGFSTQLGGYVDLNSGIKWVAFICMIIGFGLVIYGRAKVRKDSGA